MIRSVAVTLVAALLLGASAPPQQSPVQVDARFDLLSLMFHLAGQPGYTDIKVPQYAEAIRKHFATAKDHAAIAATRELGSRHRIAFFHPMNLAAHLSAPPALEERVPLDAPGLAIGARWQAAPFRPYLEQLRGFWHEARVGEFLASQASLHTLTADRLRAIVEAGVDEAWFRAYFGAAPSIRFAVVPSLINGGAQYGATYRAAGIEEAYAVIGVFKVDDQGLPRFDGADGDNIAHEYAHTLTNTHVDGILEQIAGGMPARFEAARDLMRRQSYGTWQTMAYEQVVRAVVVRYIAAKRGDAAAETEIDAQEKLGFSSTRPIAAALAGWERTRRTGDSFAAVMPRIVEILK